mmetsp:Transcript_32787/g.35350  ORF Transcript_32787/g.35350 Transcript_32787/m.35350 type:complete len:403 (-) Transcript_32787:2593-3801(-)
MRNIPSDLLLCFSLVVGFNLSNGFISSPSREYSFPSLLKSSKDPNEFAKSMSSQAIDQMKNLKPGDIDNMLQEFENMNPIQKNALKAMNMDPAMMKKTMEMMRDNPSMVAQAQKVMETMSPDELLEQSRMAQEQLSKMAPEDLESVNKAIKNSNDAIDATVDDEGDKSMETGPGSSSDSEVIDAMFRVGCLMSDPPTTDVTLEGFYSLPVIQLLSGDREFDLSMRELKECWADGSLGAERVDRVGFERVWKEVKEYFEDDIMQEARKEASKKISFKKKRRDGSTTTTIGDNMSKKELEEVNDLVKNLSSNEVGSVLDTMEEMDPASEARLKSMGVDPKLMKETATMLKDNPQLREQAKQMMQNMSPEDMLKASQQAQEQMSNMSEADVKKAIEQLKNPPPTV